MDADSLELHEAPGKADIRRAKLEGAQLRRERDALGLTQAELGRHLGVRPNTIARWERGELKIEHAGMLRLALRALRAKAARSPESRQRITGKVVRAQRPKR